LGNRQAKDVWTSATGVVTTHFALDGENALADLNSSNQLQTRRLYLNSADSLFARLSSAGTAAWYLGDSMGTVRQMVDAAGVPSNTLTYDGFGKITTESNVPFGDRYQYTAREFDAESGLQFNRARYYDQAAG